MKKQLRTLFILLLASATCANCARAGIIDITEAKEIRLGKEAAEAVIRQYGLVEDKAEVRRMNAIGDRIVKACDRPDLEYHFHIINSDIINAFAIPGGYIFMTRGIMDFIDDDDELASVIGHEVTHVAKRHGVVLYKKSMKDALVNLLVMVLTRDPNAVVAGQMIEQSRTDVYGRGAEIEADRIGLEYAKKAEYDPNGFMRFILKLQRYETHRPDLIQDYYDFHPPMDARIQLVGENFRRLGLDPPTGLSYEISGRLIAMEICASDGKSCMGTIKGPGGELFRLGDSGEEASPYLRARKISASLNKLFDKKIGFYELKKVTTANGLELIVRNTKVVRVLPGDLEANGMESADSLMDLWIDGLKRFLWNDFLKEDL